MFNTSNSLYLVKIKTSGVKTKIIPDLLLKKKIGIAKKNVLKF